MISSALALLLLVGLIISAAVSASPQPPADTNGAVNIIGETIIDFTRDTAGEEICPGASDSCWVWDLTYSEVCAPAEVIVSFYAAEGDTEATAKESQYIDLEPDIPTHMIVTSDNPIAQFADITAIYCS